MKKKTIITIAVLGAIGYYIYSRKKAGKPLNPFSNSKSFTADEGTFFESAIND
jgi:hypothetical protein